MDSPTENIMQRIPMTTHYEIGQRIFLEWAVGQHAWYIVTYAGLWAGGEQYLECRLEAAT